MKSSSDDMLDVLLAEDSEEGRRARELLLHNTELNSCSPPLSPHSGSFRSPRLSSAFSDDLDVHDKDGSNHHGCQLNDMRVEHAVHKVPNGYSGVLSILECHITSCS